MSFDVLFVKIACYITAMTTELPSALTVEYCGVDPLFNSCLKLHICDVLRMKEDDSHSGQLLYIYLSCAIYAICSVYDGFVFFVNSTQLNRELRTQVSDTSKSASSLYTIINEQYHFMASSDRFPVPVRSAVKSNFSNWCCQNLSKRALNALTVQASTTELGKLFQIFAIRAEKKLS